MTGLSITCKGTLSFGLKAFAGICSWREISDVATNYDRAYAYTGGDDTNTWIGNENAALAEMR